MLQQACKAYEEGRFTDAVEFCTEALRVDPEDVWVSAILHGNRAAAHMQMGQYAEAACDCEHVSSLGVSRDYS